MTWAINKSYRFEAVEVTKETDRTVFFISRWGDRGRETRGNKNKFLDWRGDEDTARALVAKLTSAEAEFTRRRQTAVEWYSQRKAEILASCDRSPEGQDAQRLDAQHESAVPRADEADAQGEVGSTPSPTGEL